MEVVSSSAEGSEGDDDTVLQQIRAIGISAQDRANVIRAGGGAAAGAAATVAGLSAAATVAGALAVAAAVPPRVTVNG